MTWAEVKTLALEVFKKQGRETIDRITHGHGFKQFLELEAAPDKWAVFVNDCKEALA